MLTVHELALRRCIINRSSLNPLQLTVTGDPVYTFLCSGVAPDVAALGESMDWRGCEADANMFVDPTAADLWTVGEKEENGDNGAGKAIGGAMAVVVAAIGAVMLR